MLFTLKKKIDKKQKYQEEEKSNEKIKKKSLYNINDVNKNIANKINISIEEDFDSSDTTKVTIENTDNIIEINKNIRNNISLGFESFIHNADTIEVNIENTDTIIEISKNLRNNLNLGFESFIHNSDTIEVNIESNNNIIEINKNIGNIIKLNFETSNNIYNKIDKTYNDNSVFFVNKKMDITDNNNMLATNIEIINNKKMLEESISSIKTITNVYQEVYKNETKPTGFGDFIRGCYFVLQFCIKNNKKFELVINHPLSKYLKNKYTKNINKNDITLFHNVNFNSNIDSQNNIFNFNDKNIINDFLHYLNETSIYNENLFIYCISFPFENVSLYEKKIMRRLLEPCDEIKSLVEKVLNHLNLVKYNYNIIHIRSGDNYLNSDTTSFNNSYIQNICGFIKKCLKKNENYLLIADNNFIKKTLSPIFPFIKYYLKNINHLGNGFKKEDENIKNTMIDFYILSLSKEIFSFSFYEHGSGFSKWCAVTYNIPYSCKLVK